MNIDTPLTYQNVQNYNQAKLRLAKRPKSTTNPKLKLAKLQIYNQAKTKAS
jgi:hypothetical protein